MSKISKYKNKYHLKLAVKVETWEELQSGHDWWLEDPKNRSFLPGSTVGKWCWYRLLNKKKMLVNFFREGEGSSEDQPSLHTWLYWNSDKENFASILGSPVEHSRTPSEQRDFFNSINTNICSIDIEDHEFTNENISFLRSLGLKFCAITSTFEKLGRLNFQIRNLN